MQTMGLPDPKQLVRDGRKAATIARLAVEAGRARRSEDPERARRAIAELMVGERGLPAKLAQFLGADDDAFRSASAIAQGEPVETIEQVVEKALGRPPAKAFREFCPESHAASIGQVHRAVLTDGQEVAVKVRYPGIESSLASELRLLGLVPGFGPLKTWGFDLDGYRALIADDLREELDYQAEAGRQQRMGAALHVDGLVVPRIHSALCRSNLLVQSWEAGEPLARLRDFSIETKKAAARILLRTFFQSLFEIGELHADPNPDNYAFRLTPAGSPEVILMDWGCTLTLERRRRLALLKLLLACRDRGVGAASSDVVLLDAFATMGFDVGKLVAIEARLPALCRMLFAPFLTDQPINPTTWRLATRIESLLGEHRWWFRAAGPPDSLLLMRAFHGLLNQLGEIGIALPWWPELEAGVSRETLAEARTFAVPSCEAQIAGRRATVAALATHLRVQVVEKGQQKVALSMPAEAALGLDDLVPEEARTVIAQEGVDLDALTQRIRDSGIAPQSIIDIRQDAKHYRVWLE